MRHKILKNLFHIPINPNRIYGLDILRAFAILTVVISHGMLLLPDGFTNIHKLLVYDGVSFFFVLSGFLIGGILIKILENNPATKKELFNFWIRRWFRTLPNYFLILILLGIISSVFQPYFGFGQIKKYFIFSQNLFYPHPGFFPEAWSLSVEEWFYLLIPVLLFSLIAIFKTKPKNAVLISAIGILVAVTLYRFLKFQHLQTQDYTNWDLQFNKQVFTRLDSLMFGLIGAYIHWCFHAFWLRFKTSFFVIGLALIALSKIIRTFSIFPADGLFNAVFSFTLISLATLLLLPFLSNFKSGKGFVFRALTRISLISYSMYLINFSLIYFWILNQGNRVFIVGNDPVNVAINYGLYWVITILLSTLLYKYFEIPTTQFRDHRWVKKWLD